MNSCFVARGALLAALVTAASPAFAAQTFNVNNTFDLATAHYQQGGGYGVSASADLASLTVGAGDRVIYTIDFAAGQSITMTQIDSLVGYLKGTSAPTASPVQSGTLKLLGTDYSLNSGPVSGANNDTLGVIFSFDAGTLIDAATGTDLSEGTYTITGLQWDGTFNTAGTYTLSGFAVSAEAGTSNVPEPASWAMMIGGFGMIGAVARRKRVAVSFG